MNGSNHRSCAGIVIDCAIPCPTCAEDAGSFRLLGVDNNRGSIDAEFYHPSATCTGSMILSRAAALDLLRLALDSQSTDPMTLPTAIGPGFDDFGVIVVP